MIEQMPGFPPNVLAFSAHGRLTREDYETVIIPAVDAALKTHPKLRLLYEIASFEGIEPGAAWDDFKVGMGHWTSWERVAMVTDVDWMRATVDALRFMMPATVRTFPMAEESAARAWIVAA